MKPTLKPSDEDLQNRFLYHPPRNRAQVDAHSRVSQLTLALAKHAVRWEVI